MGTPLPPNKPGANCFVCWGTGKQFGDTPTPLVITAQLFSLIPGDFWDLADEQLLLTQHLLIQGPGPCRFQVSDAKFSWALNYFPDRTIFSILRLSDQRSVFGYEALPACMTTIPNQQISPDNVIAYNGIAHLTWDLEGLE